jgi:molybdenum cofactor cytidylyltransferase
MQPAKTLARLFEEEPRQWRLRGDPHLWREMRDTLERYDYPDTEERLAALLEATYQHLTGMPLSHHEPFFIERFSHGGMSSGYVSPPFWTEIAIPLLRARYGDTR